VDDPRTFAEALTRKDAPKWRAAMDAELAALTKACTYSLVPRPTDRKPIGCRAVLKVKRGADGQIIKYKARIVAKGYSQTYGIDYDETYAPVVRYSSLRMVLALAAHYDLELHHMDVKSAYLNGDLEEEIYMEQPEGAPIIKGKEDWVCRLHKSLYGLKQAGRTWHTKIDEAFQRRGLVPLASDPCVYIRRTETSLIIIALYVDDLVLAASALSELQALKADLTAEFDMEDLGEASFVLGIEIVRDRASRTITITQTAYTKALVDRHITGHRHKQHTPMESSARHVKAADGEQATTQSIRAYQSAVGSVMFAMLCTRPDIAFSVAILSKFAQNPTPIHEAGVQRVLRYLHGTNARGITYTGTTPVSEEPQLTGYCDSDWAADRDDRKSITGYAFLLSGGAISWSSKKQKTPSLSSVEAEYMAAAAAAKEALWWRTQLRGLGYDTAHATTLYSDSQGSISLSKNPDHHANTKHIALRYHFIRHHVGKRNVRLEYINTTAMAADVLTKALPREQHETTAAMLGMVAV
jgi:Reverse transcriptase (RNA-dependent DNA polymerase)